MRMRTTRSAASRVAHRILLLVSLTAGFGAAAAGNAVAAPEEPNLSESPVGQVLVVNANLQEVFQAADVEDPTDMRNFARILVTQVPYAPDVLLLQEVRQESTENVVRFLTEETGHQYTVGIAPEQVRLDNGTVVRDTAVVLNSDTLRQEEEGGFIRSAPNRDGRLKDHAHLLVKELRGGTRVSLASVHYAHRGDIVEWVNHTVSTLDSTYPSPSKRQIEVIAGDFNVKRCEGGDSWKWESLDCEENVWYDLLTEQFGYTDAVLTASPEEIPQAQLDDVARIDFIFARGAVMDGASDLDTKRELASLPQCGEVNREYFLEGRGAEAPEPCNALFYTDHRLVWSLVGMPIGPDASDDKPAEQVVQAQ